MFESLPRTAARQKRGLDTHQGPSCRPGAHRPGKRACDALHQARQRARPYKQLATATGWSTTAVSVRSIADLGRKAAARAIEMQFAVVGYCNIEADRLTEGASRCRNKVLQRLCSGSAPALASACRLSTASVRMA
ncbi:hypothetical protein CCR96_17325 [Halochromatium roseum]|nr:hypothetical protein [Halochromatium roseum]